MVWTHVQVAFYSCFGYAFDVAILTGFYLLIGFSEMHMAAYGSLIGLGCFFGFLGPLIMQKNGSPKKTSLTLLIIAVFACLAGVLFGAFGGWFRFMPIVVLACIAVYQAVLHMATPVLLPWFHNLVNTADWPGFLSTRFVVADVSILALTPVVGFLLLGAQDIDPFLLVFSIAAVLGFIGVYFLSKLPDTTISVEQTGIKTYLKQFADAAKNKGFRSLLLIAFFRFFAYGLIIPFQAMFLIEKLEFDYTTITILVGGGTAISIIFYKVWAYLQKRFGNNRCLKWNILLSAFDPFLWLFATQESSVIIFISVALFGLSGFRGVVNAGYFSSYIGALYHSATEQEKPVFHALYFLVAGVGTLTAPIISGSLLRHFNRVPIVISNYFPSGFDGYKVIFTCACIMLLTTGIFAFLTQSGKTAGKLTK